MHMRMECHHTSSEADLAGDTILPSAAGVGAMDSSRQPEGPKMPWRSCCGVRAAQNQRSVLEITERNHSLERKDEEKEMQPLMIRELTSLSL